MIHGIVVISFCESGSDSFAARIILNHGCVFHVMACMTRTTKGKTSVAAEKSGLRRILIISVQCVT